MRNLLTQLFLSLAQSVCFPPTFTLPPDVLNQLETTTTTLTPSSELTSGPQSAVPSMGSSGTELASLDLTSLFSSVSASATAGPVSSVGGPVAASATAFTMDVSLVNSGILTIDPGSVGSALGAKPVDPLILAAGADMSPHVLDAGPPGVLPQGSLNLDDVQTVNPEALGSLTTLAIQGPAGAEQLHALSSSSALASEPPSSSLTPALSSSLAPSLSSLTPALSASATLTATTVPDLLSPAPPKTDAGVVGRASGPLLGGGVEVLGQTDSKAMAQFVFPSHSTTYGSQKETELGAVTPCPFLVSQKRTHTHFKGKVLDRSTLSLVV